MRRAIVLAVSLAITGGVAVSNAAAAGSVRDQFNVALSGQQEVPPADPDGTGRAVVSIQDGTICYQVQVRMIDQVTASHIHEAPVGVEGGVVVPLVGTWRGNPNGAQVLRGCTTNSAEAADISANPANYYVNVHTGDYPKGAVRGQLG